MAFLVDIKEKEAFKEALKEYMVDNNPDGSGVDMSGKIEIADLAKVDIDNDAETRTSVKIDGKDYTIVITGGGEDDLELAVALFCNEEKVCDFDEYFDVNPYIDFAIMRDLKPEALNALSEFIKPVLEGEEGIDISNIEVGAFDKINLKSGAITPVDVKIGGKSYRVSLEGYGSSDLELGCGIAELDDSGKVISDTSIDAADYFDVSPYIEPEDAE